MSPLFATVLSIAVVFFLIDALLPRPSKRRKRLLRSQRPSRDGLLLRATPVPGISPFGKQSSSSDIRGRLGENWAAFELEGLDGSIYELYHDLYLTRTDGQGTAQIDHIVLSPYGIFVIETKNLSGWIYGREREPRWTQVLAGGIKNTFQNPLHQNYCHTEALRCHLNLPKELFLSVIFLPGNCELKKALPDNVITRDLARYIESHHLLRLTQEQLDKARSQITTLLSIDKEAVRTKHVKSLRERHGDRMFFMAA